MAEGGIMRLAPGGQMSGGTLSAIASLKVTNPDIYEKYKDDPKLLAQMAKSFLQVAEDPEMTTLEALEAPSTSFKTSNFRDNVAGGLKTYMQRRKDDKEFGEDYDRDQRRQSINAVRRAEKDPDSMLFDTGLLDESSVEGSRFAKEESIPFNRMADPSSRYQSRLPSAGFQNERTDINASGDPSETGSTGVFTNASGDPSETSTSDPLAYRAEKARRAYLAGRDYNESDVPAIVDMLNRGREFQQSDTYTPPEQVYTDLGANSPLGGLKYTMDGASEDEQAKTFAQYADRLGVERGIAQDIKEQGALAAAANKRRIAGDAMDEDVAMEQGLEGPGFLQRLSGAIDETIGSEDPAVKFNKMLYEKNKAEADAKAANIASTLDNENRLQKRQLTGLETITAAQKLKDEAAAKKIIEATGDNDKGKQTFKSTAENMNQDKWLALAQAGLTLMSTGDFGKAGSAGLAALRESKKNDLAERKIAADERLTDARIAAANKKTSGIKAPAAAALSFYQKQIDNAQIALDDAKTTTEKVAARKRLTNAQNALRQLVDRYELSMGIFGTGANSSGIDEYDLTSKAG
jgi:hypothetical protein